MVPEQRNKKILDEVKKVTHAELPDILRRLDPELVKGALGGEHFLEYFETACKDEAIAEAVREVLQ